MRSASSMRVCPRFIAMWVAARRNRRRPLGRIRLRSSIYAKLLATYLVWHWQCEDRPKSRSCHLVSAEVRARPRAQSRIGNVTRSRRPFQARARHSDKCGRSEASVWCRFRGPGRPRSRRAVGRTPSTPRRRGATRTGPRRSSTQRDRPGRAALRRRRSEQSEQ